MGADGEQAVVPGEALVGGEFVEQGEPGRRPVDHRHRDGPVEGDHRIGVETQQQVVQHQDLRPVGGLRRRRLTVHGGDRRLHLIRPGLPARQRGLDQLQSFTQEFAIPAITVLLLQRHQSTVRSGAGRPAGFGEEHQREQSRRFGVARGEAQQQPASRTASAANRGAVNSSPPLAV